MMKKISLILFALLPWLTQASTWEEQRQVIYPSGMDCQLGPLFPGKSIVRSVEFQIKDYPAKRFLRVIGGVALPAPYHRRGETLFRETEYWIDDALDSLTTQGERYSLYFKGHNEAFERYAYYRLPGHLLTPGKLKVQLPVVKMNQLKRATNGDFGLQLHLYYQKAGRAADDIYDAPDSILYLPVPGGSCEDKIVKGTFNLPQQVACVLLQVGGKSFSGECWLGAPRLLQDRKVVQEIPYTKFADRRDPKNYWVGCNLSTRSWPVWKLEFEGKTVFEGPVFDRASQVADFYLPLPKDLPNRGSLKLTLVEEEHGSPFAYNLRKMEILEMPARDFEVVAVPKYVPENQPFGVLVETNKAGADLKVSYQRGDSSFVQQYRFGQPGLQVVQLRAGAAGSALPLCFEDARHQENVAVEQVIEKDPEAIYVSSGDEIYLDKRYQIYDEFFKWYFAQRVGNWYQFRPSYQWSGFRVSDPTFVKHYTGLLHQLQVPYAWQVEGRTLAGNRLNPDLKDLKTAQFRGKQAHENDGGYYYWQHFKYEGLYSDLAARHRPYGGIFAKHRPIYTDHGTFIHYDTQKVKDMADGARYFVDNLKYSKGESTRHTGPSTLFRYFYQAGYDWLGAEQMYGPEEIILSALRGASRAYGRTDYGTLHAMQWGSYPFTDPQHALRFYQSLALAYMHGSSHLNTEEGLWTDEYMNDRYSEAGKAHLYAQHQVLDFVETHTRRGELQSAVAVIQGRNDAWKSFCRGPLWSQQGEKWRFNAACESFDLLKVFYPGNAVDCCGPQGWFSSTPYGTVDLLPVEASQTVMKSYKALMFLGWNTYDAKDFWQIVEYVRGGGTLLLTAAHLNAELQPNAPVKFPEEDEAIRELLGDGYRQLKEKTVLSCGLGKVVYFPQTQYPAEEIRAEYEAAMREIAAEAIADEAERGWVTPGAGVGFTVWDQLDRRTLYLLNIDWQSKESVQTAVFRYGGHEFPISVGRYQIATLHCSEGLAVMPMSNTTDVLSIRRLPKGWKVRYQTTRADALQCMMAASGQATTLHCDRAGIYEVEIPE